LIISGAVIRYTPYSKKVQRYSKEEASLFEELRYGLFLGTAGFADRLKSRFLKEAHPELPQQIKLLSREYLIEFHGDDKKHRKES
jgi:hypothetical protein